MKTRDGHVVIVPATQEQFRKLSAAAGHPEWFVDPRFSRLRDRDANWIAMMQVIEGWTSTLLATEVEGCLLKAGVPCATFRSVAEALRDPQTLARGSLVSVSDAAGQFMVPRAPFLLASEAGARQASRVPALGEHTQEVRGSVQ